MPSQKFGPTMSFWQDYLNIQFDPAHLLSEVGFTVVFDGLILALGGKLVKRYIRRTAHEEHSEHDRVRSIND